MNRRRDVDVFGAPTDVRAGWRGRLRHEIADRAAAVALSVAPAPRMVLDVGCGTGYLLRVLASRCPDALALVGIDAASSMVTVARPSTGDARAGSTVAVAEHLPFPDATFDLVVTTTAVEWRSRYAVIVNAVTAAA